MRNQKNRIIKLFFDSQPNQRYFQTIMAPRIINYSLVLVLFLFALNSYPMLYTGYDFQYHLNAINNPKSLANQNIYWHEIWQSIFTLLSTESSDSVRALIIHRTQVILTFILIGAGSYIFLDESLKKINKHHKIQLSIIAIVIWLIMHGTFSSPSGEPHYSAKHILSWLQWYSVNYQITLPMFVLASACLFKFSNSKQTLKKTLWLIVSLILCYFIGRIHAAELAYFIFLAFGILVIYTLPNKSLWFSFASILIIFISIKIALEFSYRQPIIFYYFRPETWSELIYKINTFGHLIVGGNLNRSQTGWHSLYSLSLVACIFTIFFTKNVATIKFAMLLIYSSFLAIAIQIHHSAGFLALVIGEYVTWRFAFSTLLFLGIPLLVGVWLEQRSHTDSPLRTSVLALGVPTGVLVLVALYSRFFEPLQPAYNFAKSLLFSLDPVLGHFPITP
jgi:hypothetical protein